MTFDDYRADAPITIGASFWTLLLDMVPHDEWQRMTAQERCECMEARGWRWDGQFWRKPSDDALAGK